MSDAPKFLLKFGEHYVRADEVAEALKPVIELIRAIDPDLLEEE